MSWGSSWGAAWGSSWGDGGVEPPEPPAVVQTKGFAGWSTYTEKELRAIEEARRLRERTKREREVEIRRAVERAFAELTGDYPETSETSETSELPKVRRLDRNIEALDRILARLAVGFDAIEQADIEYRLAQRLAAIEDDEISALLLLDA